MGTLTPNGITEDSNGNIYVADIYGGCIFKTSSTGPIRFASGFKYPASLAYDGINIFVADYGNNLIKWINPADGIVNTIAGTFQNPYGLYYDLSTGFLYYTEYKLGGHIWKISNPTGTPVFTDTNIIINYPSSILIRNSILYIVSPYDKCIYKAIQRNTAITLVKYVGPLCDTLCTSTIQSSYNNLYISTVQSPYSTSYISSVQSSFSTLCVSTQDFLYSTMDTSTIQLCSPGLSLNLTAPNSIAYDPINNIIFISDYINDQVYSINSLNTIEIIAGTGMAGYSGDTRQGSLATINKPTYLYYSQQKGKLFISDYANGKIRTITINQGNTIRALVTTTTLPQFPKWTTTTLQSTMTLAPIPLPVLGNTNIITLKRIPATITTKFIQPTNISAFYIDKLQSNFTTTSILYYISSGKLYSYILETTTSTQIIVSTSFGTITCITMDTEKNIYMCDSTNNYIWKLSNNGTINTVSFSTSLTVYAGNGTAGWNGDTIATNTKLNAPTWIGFDKNGILYISDTGNYCIRRINIIGLIETVVNKPLSGNPTVNTSTIYTEEQDAIASQMNSPSGFVFDSNNSIIVCDKGTNAIYKITEEGRLSLVCADTVNTPIKYINSVFDDFDQVAINISLTAPTYITIDSKNALYVSSSMQIVKITTVLIDKYSNSYSTKVNLLAGIGTDGIARYNSTDVYAKYASLGNISGMQVLSDGTLYFLDSTSPNSYIRYISPEINDTYSTGLEGIIKYSPLSIIANYSIDTYNTSIVQSALTEELKASMNNFKASALCVDDLGNTYVANIARNNIIKIDQFGKVTEIINSLIGLKKPMGISIYNNSILYVSDTDNDQIISCFVSNQPNNSIRETCNITPVDAFTLDFDIPSGEYEYLESGYNGNRVSASNYSSRSFIRYEPGYGLFTNITGIRLEVIVSVSGTCQGVMYNYNGRDVISYVKYSIYVGDSLVGQASGNTINLTKTFTMDPGASITIYISTPVPYGNEQCSPCSLTITSTSNNSMLNCTATLPTTLNTNNYKIMNYTINTQQLLIRELQITDGYLINTSSSILTLQVTMQIQSVFDSLNYSNRYDPSYANPDVMFSYDNNNFLDIYPNDPKTFNISINPGDSFNIYFGFYLRYPFSNPNNRYTTNIYTTQIGHGSLTIKRIHEYNLTTIPLYNTSLVKITNDIITSQYTTYTVLQNINGYFKNISLIPLNITVNVSGNAQGYYMYTINLFSNMGDNIFTTPPITYYIYVFDNFNTFNISYASSTSTSINYTQTFQLKPGYSFTIYVDSTIPYPTTTLTINYILFNAPVIINNSISKPQANVIHPIGILFTAHTLQNTISIFNIKTNTYIGSINCSNPIALTVDKDGNLYVATSSGIIWYPIPYTITSSGINIPLTMRSNTFDSSAGICYGISYNKNDDCIYYSSQTYFVVWKLKAGSTDSTKRVIIAGTANVSADTPTDGTYANTTSLYKPQGIQFDNNQMLYILDEKPDGFTSLLQIPSLMFLKKDISYIIAGGPNALSPGTDIKTQNNLQAIIGKFGQISGVCTGLDGSIYLSDSVFHCIWKIDVNGILSVFAGIGTAGITNDPASTSTGSQLNTPLGIAISKSGSLYICDSLNNRILRVSDSGSPPNTYKKLFIVAGNTGSLTNLSTIGSNQNISTIGTNAIESYLWLPNDIVIDKYENIYVSDSGHNRILKITPLGIILVYVGGRSVPIADGADPLQVILSNPTQLALNSLNELHFINYGTNQILKVSASGNIAIVAGTGASSTSISLTNPKGICINTNNEIYISDTGANIIRKISNDKQSISTVVGNGLVESQPSNSATNIDGNGETPLAPLEAPGYLATDLNNRLYITQITKPKLTLIPFTNTDPCGLTGRYIRIEGQGQQIKLMRITVYNSTGGIISLPSSSIKSSSTASSLAPVANILSPTNSTLFMTATSGLNEYVEIDIGSDTIISFINISSAYGTTPGPNESIGMKFTFLNSSREIVYTQATTPDIITSSGNYIIFRSIYAQTQCAIPPTLPLSYITSSCGVPKIQYVRIRGNQTNPIEISQIAIIDQTGTNLCLGLGANSFTTMSGSTVISNSTTINMVDGFFASKSKSYLATTANESVVINLGTSNTDIIFISMYLGLSNKMNMIGASVDLLDANNTLITTRKIKNIFESFSLEYVLFDFRQKSLFSPCLNNKDSLITYKNQQIGTSGTNTFYTDKLIRYIQINISELYVSNIVITSKETGEDLAFRKKILFVSGTSTSTSTSINNLPNLVDGTYASKPFASSVTGTNMWIEIDLTQEYLIEDIIIYTANDITTTPNLNSPELNIKGLNKLRNPISIVSTNQKTSRTKYIRIQGSGVANFSIQSIQAFNTPVKPSTGYLTLTNCTITSSSGSTTGILGSDKYTFSTTSTYNVGDCVYSNNRFWQLATPLANGRSSVAPATPTWTNITPSFITTSVANTEFLQITLNTTAYFYYFILTYQLPTANQMNLQLIQYNEDFIEISRNTLYGYNTSEIVYPSPIDSTTTKYILPSPYKFSYVPKFGMRNVRFIKYYSVSPKNTALQCSRLIVIDKYGTNVALNKPVSGYSINYGNTINNITKDIDSSDSVGYKSSGTGLSEYLQIDLGQEYEVIFVKYWNLTTNLIWSANTSISLLDSFGIIIASRTVQGGFASEILNFTNSPVVLLPVSQFDSSWATRDPASIPSWIWNSMNNTVAAGTVVSFFTTFTYSTSVIGTCSIVYLNSGTARMYLNGIALTGVTNSAVTWSTVALPCITGTNTLQVNITTASTGKSGFIAYFYAPNYTGVIYFNHTPSSWSLSMPVPLTFTGSGLSDPFLTKVCRARYIRLENPGLSLTNIIPATQGTNEPCLMISQIVIYDIFGRNVAVGKPTRSSSLVLGTNTANAINNKILDTSTNTPIFQSYNNSYISDKITGSWWEVDLGDEYSIARIDYYHTDITNSTTPTLETKQNSIINLPLVLYGRNREEYLRTFINPVAYTKNSIQTIPIMNTSYTISPTNTVQGQQIRFIRITSQYDIIIRQLVVIDYTGANVAVGKATRTNSIGTTSISNSSFYPVNGRFNSVYVGISSVNNFWEVDLGRNYFITSVIYYGDINNTHLTMNLIAYDYSYRQVGSINTINYNEIKKTIPYSSGPQSVSALQKVGVKARYVRLEKTTVISISQLAIIDCLGRNVAFGKKVYSSYTNKNINSLVSGTLTATTNYITVGLMQNATYTISTDPYNYVTNSYTTTTVDCTLTSALPLTNITLTGVAPTSIYTFTNNQQTTQIQINLNASSYYGNTLYYMLRFISANGSTTSEYWPATLDANRQPVGSLIINQSKVLTFNLNDSFTITLYRVKNTIPNVNKDSFNYTSSDYPNFLNAPFTITDIDTATINSPFNIIFNTDIDKTRYYSLKDGIYTNLSSYILYFNIFFVVNKGSVNTLQFNTIVNNPAIPDYNILARQMTYITPALPYTNYITGVQAYLNTNSATTIIPLLPGGTMKFQMQRNSSINLPKSNYTFTASLSDQSIVNGTSNGNGTINQNHPLTNTEIFTTTDSNKYTNISGLKLNISFNFTNITFSTNINGMGSKEQKGDTGQNSYDNHYYVDIAIYIFIYNIDGTQSNAIFVGHVPKLFLFRGLDVDNTQKSPYIIYNINTSSIDILPYQSYKIMYYYTPINDYFSVGSPNYFWTPRIINYYEMQTLLYGYSSITPSISVSAVGSIHINNYTYAETGTEIHLNVTDFGCIDKGALTISNTSSGPAPSAFIEVDLGEEYYIKNITGYSVPRMNTNTINETQPFNTDLQGTTVTLKDANQVVMSYVARYIKYCNSGYNNFLQCSRLIIKDITGTDVGLNKPFTFFSINSNSLPSITNGADVVSSWPYIYMSANTSSNEYIQVDLGKEYSIASVRYLNSSSFPNRSNGTFIQLIANDGTSVVNTINLVGNLASETFSFNKSFSAKSVSVNVPTTGPGYTATYAETIEY